MDNEIDEENALTIAAHTICANAVRCSESDQLLEKLKRVAQKTKIYAFKRRFKKPIDIVSKVKRKRIDGKKSLNELSSAADIAPPPASYEDERVFCLPDKQRAAFEKAFKDINYEPRHLDDSLGCRYVTGLAPNAGPRW